MSLLKGCFTQHFLKNNPSPSPYVASGLHQVDVSKTTPSDHDGTHMTPVDESMSSEAKQ